MNGKQLRNSILQWAIQGKLVPQDPNDEPASVLLDRIRQEKERLIKEKKIKRDKNASIIYRGEDNSHYEKFLATGEVKCIDDEIPFELPDGWEWIRLGNIVDFSKAQSICSAQITPNTWVLDLEDIEKDTGKVIRKKRMAEVHSKSDKHLFFQGNVLYSKLRPYLNKVVLADEDGVCTSEILAFDFSGLYNQYAQFYLMSPFFVDYAMSDAYGVKMPRLGSKQGNAALMPIPPLEEQQRIVDKIKEVLPKVEQYGIIQNSLNNLSEGIKPILKKSILQEAIQGRLVPQIAEEGTAQDLLESIKQEKLHLVKEGKLKKSALTDSVIFKGDDNAYYEQIGNDTSDITDEIPFDIPSNWKWARLKMLCTICTGATFKKEEASTDHIGVRVLRGGNILPFELVNKPDDLFIPEQKVKENIILRRNDIVTPAVTSLENIGKMARVKENMAKVTVGGFVFILRPLHFSDIFSRYLLAYMSSPSAIEYMKSITNKSGQAFYNIGKERLATTLVPLPPLAEQDRICNRIEEVFSKIKA